MTRVLPLLLASLLPLTAAAQVTVTALRDPVSKSYRKMAAGAELFEQRRALAPEAELRFKLLPRKKETRMDEVQVDVLGDSFTLPVDVAPDRTFSLPRDAKAIAEDAAVRPNRRAQTMTWRAEIRSPGVPPDARRLGDLRLECEVGMTAELVSNRTKMQAFLDNLTGLSGYCDRTADNWYLFFAERPLFGVTLVHGDRREALPVGRLWNGASDHPDMRKTLPNCDCEVLVERTYDLPLGDKSWPDDTLVVFEYMDDGRTEPLPDLGIADRVVSFDNGYSARIYKTWEKQPKGGLMRLVEEKTVLVSPEGKALKSRTWIPDKSTRG